MTKQMIQKTMQRTKKTIQDSVSWVPTAWWFLVNTRASRAWDRKLLSSSSVTGLVLVRYDFWLHRGQGTKGEDWYLTSMLWKIHRFTDKHIHIAQRNWYFSAFMSSSSCFFLLLPYSSIDTFRQTPSDRNLYRIDPFDHFGPPSASQRIQRILKRKKDINLKSNTKTNKISKNTKHYQSRWTSISTSISSFSPISWSRILSVSYETYRQLLPSMFAVFAHK